MSFLLFLGGLCALFALASAVGRHLRRVSNQVPYVAEAKYRYLDKVDRDGRSYAEPGLRYDAAPPRDWRVVTPASVALAKAYQAAERRRAGLDPATGRPTARVH